MSGGGLLEKAMGQQMSPDGESMVDEVVAEALPQSMATPKLEFPISVKLGAGIGLIAFLLMWFLDSYTLQDFVDPDSIRINSSYHVRRLILLGLERHG